MELISNSVFWISLCFAKNMGGVCYSASFVPHLCFIAFYITLYAIKKSFSKNKQLNPKYFLSQ